ncbi:ATP-dependent 6-phosphofructokinase [Ramlibacter monticola]|uniref:ATP-dependent 6-phosphofructokinase n=1 Tax=Ramlibacter monticola TaxID=1926872 RepID=A0A936Z8V5_9BURK|nr:ATP-dependent 6-phosphofructokinase [Ramlibacter monticola]MBL0395249.1 ATP-dependent 6-phosphofructokinase [Ramlibacter monticola]
MSRPRRIGILTGGGDSPGLNAVIRAVAKSLMQDAGAEVVGFVDGFAGMIERQSRALAYRDVSGILTLGGTILGTSNKANPFAYHARGNADVSAQVVAYVRDELKLDAVVAIGGDGTMSMAHRMHQLGIPMVGVPKTIDNDLMYTDRTFGFDTAVAIATDAMDRLHTTAQSHHRVMILETMGRYAGWIALYAGVAGGADIILIPEFEYEIEEIARICRERQQGGQRFTLICVAEGAKAKGGELAVRQVVADSPDPLRLGGVCNVLEHHLSQRVGSEVRTAILGHVQRGGTPTAFDRTLATAFGAYAAALVADEQYGRMAATQQGRLTSVAIADVANRQRTVAPDAPMVATAMAVGSSFGVPGMKLRFDGRTPSAFMT